MYLEKFSDAFESVLALAFILETKLAFAWIINLVTNKELVLFLNLHANLTNGAHVCCLRQIENIQIS
jgi:hypothetical protein